MIQLPCIAELARVERQLTPYGGSTHYEWFTEWIPCTGIKTVRVAWSQRAESGTFSGRPAYQLAEVRTDLPDDGTEFTAGFQTGEGAWTAEEDLSGAGETPDHFWIRFGVAYKATGSGSATVGLNVTLENYGEVAGARSGIMVSALSTTDNFVPVSGWIPTVRIQQIKAALVYSDATGGIRVGLATQTADSDRLQPNSWTVFDTSLAAPTSANTERLIADTSFTPQSDNAMWVRFGIVYDYVTTVGYAEVACAVGVIRS